MSWALITYTFSPSTTIKSSDMNTNFSNVVAGLNTAAPSGIIVMWSGSVGTIPTGWYLCDGNNGTPNLVGKFVQGAGSGYAVGAVGGSASISLSIANMPSHDHGSSTSGRSAGHTHQLLQENGNTGTLSGGALGSYTGYPQSGTGTPTGGESADHVHYISAQGSGTAFENRPPFYTLAFIMKS